MSAPRVRGEALHTIGSLASSHACMFGRGREKKVGEEREREEEKRERKGEGEEGLDCWSRTSCSSMLLTGASDFSTVSVPCSGAVMSHVAVVSVPSTRKSGTWEGRAKGGRHEQTGRMGSMGTMGSMGRMGRIAE